MRLINCETLQLEEFIGSQIPNYAILSHTWGPQEVSFSEYTSNRTAAESKSGYKKIYFACTQAYNDRIPYVWVDTCCIDKSSSAELSESINSMYKWYRDSKICYAYLPDVSKASFDMEFPKSRWFSRGWTLQELIAPAILNFYDQNWCIMGSKKDHAKLISGFTRIDKQVLERSQSRLDLSIFCVAKRMSWASKRETTRVEDIAYCLLGIFNVNMPLLYGEGERAFIRLQEEIIRAYNDDSILAWGLDREIKPRDGLIPEEIIELPHSYTRKDYGPFAESPDYFENCQDIEYNGHSKITSLTMTSLGLQIELPLVRIPTWPDKPTFSHMCGWIGLLGCSSSTDIRVPGIVLSSDGEPDESPSLVERMGFGDSHSAKGTFLLGVRVINQATVAKIIIQRYKPANIFLAIVPPVYRHVIINESQALREVGYRTSSVSGCGVYGHDLRGSWSTSEWSAEENVFTTTVRGLDLGEELVCVCFESCFGGHVFCVFILNENAIVRKGFHFTKGKLDKIHAFLAGYSQDDEGDDPVMIGTEGRAGRRCRIEVSITKKKAMPHRHTTEVIIDAVLCSRESGRWQKQLEDPERAPEHLELVNLEHGSSLVNTR